MGRRGGGVVRTSQPVGTPRAMEHGATPWQGRSEGLLRRGVRRPSSTSTAAEQIFKRDPGENHVDVRLDNTWCHFCAGPPAESWKTAAKHADYLQLGLCHWSGASVVTSPMTRPFSLQRPHFCSSNESYGMSMSARARTRLSANGTLLPLAPLPSRRSRDSRTRQSNVLVLAAAGVATRQGR